MRTCSVCGKDFEVLIGFGEGRGKVKPICVKCFQAAVADIRHRTRFLGRGAPEVAPLDKPEEAKP